MSSARQILSAESTMNLAIQQFQSASDEVVQAYMEEGLTLRTIEAMEYRIIRADALLMLTRDVLTAARQSDPLWREGAEQ